MSKMVKDHPFSTYVKFSEKLTFLVPCYPHVHVSKVTWSSSPAVSETNQRGTVLLLYLSSKGVVMERVEYVSFGNY